MNRGLSILIPTYNDICTKQVERIVSLLGRLPDIDYEVVVADDCSPDRQCVAANSQISAYGRCRYIRLDKNRGRAAIRNYLARTAKYDWLLYLDCGVIVDDEDFFANYLRHCGRQTDVVCGGVKPQPPRGNSRESLRYNYEKRHFDTHPAEVRARQPYLSFRTTNFLIRKEVMVRTGIDEDFRTFGYEDVDFGRRLQAAHAGILHIDNPVSYYEYEDNATYLRKIEESLRTLSAHRDTLRRYSPLLTTLHRLRPILPLIRLFHRLAQEWERRNLTGRHPSLWVLRLYKMGYFLSL